MDKSVGIADARSKDDHIRWYIPHYTPSIPQQSNLSQQSLSTTPTLLKVLFL